MRSLLGVPRTPRNARTIVRAIAAISVLVFPLVPVSVSALADEDRSSGAVYTMTNATATSGGNAIIAFHRRANGSLSPAVLLGANGTGRLLDLQPSTFSVSTTLRI